MIDYLCVLFVGDVYKRRPLRVIRQHAGLERRFHFEFSTGVTLLFE
jgi:hypothetical protein